MKKNKDKKPKKAGKFFLILLIILLIISAAWTAVSMIGRVKADSIIPETTALRVSIPNPVRLLDGILSHESLKEISGIPELAPALSVLKTAEQNPLIKNRLLRFAARGNLEFAMLEPVEKSASLALAWDMRLFSPLLRILPVVSWFVTIPDLYYVQAGKNSRFEYRMESQTFFIGYYRNLLFVTDGSALFESRASIAQEKASSEKASKLIKQNTYDATVLLSPEFINNLMSQQDEQIAVVMENIRFDSNVELGITMSQKKLELQLTTKVSSPIAGLKRLVEQRSQAPAIADFIPGTSQYATILSAGTLQELYQAALVFSGPSLDETLKTAEKASRAILGLSLDDLLFSWSGKEFAAFGLEGRPHPVYAIQIADERKRQQTFDKAFKSIALNENVSLNLDGVRLPRIEIPDFLQKLLQQWNLYLPSPYYTIYKGCLFVSESAETLLSTLRAMQKNDVITRTQAWRNITNQKTSKSAFSLYYTLDLSVPFFLRSNTVLNSFLGIYRQGLLRMSFDRGLTELSLSLIPGFGSGISLIGSPLDISGNPSNQIFGAGTESEMRIFLSRRNSVISINPADNTIYEFSGQGPLWVIPANRDKNNFAWVVSGNGRVTLVNGDMEPEPNYPVLTGIRLSSAPVVWDGRLYLCGDDEKIYSVDANGKINVWENIFPAAVRSPPSFLSIQTKQSTRGYSAVYPKSFFSELWLLDTATGKALPGWPASMSGIGFGSPLLFARNNKAYTAFITQAGELFVFDENAVDVQPFPIMLDGIFYVQPVFDGDYLWLVSSDGMLYQISFAGEILQQHIPNFLVKEEGHIILFDCDGDKIPEVFISGEGNILHGYTRHFRSLEGFPLPIWGKPLFIDSNSNGKKEIAGMGMDRRLYRWQFK